MISKAPHRTACDTLPVSSRLPNPVARVRGPIWIDLDNTPHVPFFRPIIKQLEKNGVSVVVTARDAFQTCELATRFGLTFQKVGRHSGRSSWTKLVGLLLRAGQLLPIAFRHKPALALSHGARSQMLAANLIGIPTVMIDDYEHSRHLPMATPKWAILPEVLARRASYCEKAKIKTYPGMKEDVYAHDFEPDHSLRQELGLPSDHLVVTLRPPATAAHYHNPESEELLDQLVKRLEKEEKLSVVMLPRNRQQETELRARYPQWFATGRVIVPSRVLDGLNLIWHSDLVVSGGGTMNREAAALGVPVYSIFRGPMGAIDQWLEQHGRLVLVRNKDEVDQRIRFERRSPQARTQQGPPTLPTLVSRIEEILDLERSVKVTPSVT